MAKVNVYKIDRYRHREFQDNMAEKLTCSRKVELNQEDMSNLEGAMLLTLYKSDENINKNVSWEWILEAFDDDILQTQTNPRAVVIIEYEDEMYALTFGHSYFLVDKYCDRDFAFAFARKIKYKEIRTTALTSPNSQKNKTINTFIDYKSLEFDSGESFTKIKAKVEQSANFCLYNDLVEIGNSLKFTLKENNLHSVCELILHILEVLAKEDLYKIPVFNKVSDKELIKELDEELESEVKAGETSISISEIDIIGATEIFNNNDTTFTIGYKHKSKDISVLSQDEIERFTVENGLKTSEVLLDLKVISYNNGASVRTDKIRNLIDYVNDDRKCILSKGEWYYFNDDYQSYLEASINEIDSVYKPEYDFTTAIHQDFINKRYLEERLSSDYENLQKEEVLGKLKTKYYAERTFNTLRELENGFKNYDRDERRVGQSKVELMDLYRDKTMYAVKFGNSSSKLCYAVDQSLSSLQLYKNNSLKDMPKIENVAIWLVLERKQKLNLVNGKPAVNELNMLMLKNKLDIWKKEVRLLGYKPIIYINYRM